MYLTVPSGTPFNVSATEQSSTSIVVTWEDIPLIEQNGIIIAYEVLYEPMDTFNGLIPSGEVLNTTDTIAILTMLQEYVVYSIAIRGYTIEGPGNYSSAVIAMTLEDGRKS